MSVCASARVHMRVFGCIGGQPPVPFVCVAHVWRSQQVSILSLRCLIFRVRGESERMSMSFRLRCRNPPPQQHRRPREPINNGVGRVEAPLRPLKEGCWERGMKKREKEPPRKPADAAAIGSFFLVTRKSRAVANMPRSSVCLCASMFARGQQGQSTELWLLSQISPAFDGGDSPWSGARPNSTPLFLLQGEKFTAGSLL